MSLRIEKLNKHIQRTFGEILLKEADLPPDTLVTISRVDTAANLHSTDIWLYISPIERADEVLETLKPQMYFLQGEFNRTVKLKPLPRIRMRLDKGSHHAQHIEEKLAEIKKTKEE